MTQTFKYTVPQSTTLERVGQYFSLTSGIKTLVTNGGSEIIKIYRIMITADNTFIAQLYSDVDYQIYLSSLANRILDIDFGANPLVGASGEDVVLDMNGDALSFDTQVWITRE